MNKAPKHLDVGAKSKLQSHIRNWHLTSSTRIGRFWELFYQNCRNDERISFEVMSTIWQLSNPVFDPWYLRCLWAELRISFAAKLGISLAVFWSANIAVTQRFLGSHNRKYSIHNDVRLTFWRSAFIIQQMTICRSDVTDYRSRVIECCKWKFCRSSGWGAAPTDGSGRKWGKAGGIFVLIFYLFVDMILGKIFLTRRSRTRKRYDGRQWRARKGVFLGGGGEESKE